MKRVADKQLIKDDRDMDGDDGEEGQGFKKADDSVLAGRKIRGLPKRASAAAASSNSSGMMWTPSSASAPVEEAAPVSKFSGFTGFGAPSAPKSGFSFTSATGITSLGAAPSIQTGASDAAKTFSSFLGGASNGIEAKVTPASSEEDKPEVEYYSSLRGLNVSFVKAINQYIEEDPFVDISDVFERYKNLRNTVQKDFDSKNSGPTPKTTSNIAAPPAPPKTLSMPAPPTTFMPFGTGKPFGSSESKSTPQTGGFVFKPPTSSLFGVPPSQPSDASSPASSSFGAPSTLGTTTAPATSTKGFSFGAPSKDTSSSSSTSTTKAPFSFVAPPEATNASSLPFSLSSSTSAAPAVSTGSSSIFGEKSKEGGKEDEKADTASTPSNPFGVSSSSSSGGAFGSFGSFGKSSGSGSASNPVTFGFGSSASSGVESKPSGTFGSSPFSSSTATGGFSFGGGSAISATDKKEEEGEAEVKKEEEGSTSSADAGAASVPAMFGVNPHDTEGEGEEEEETVHAIKSKAYRMKKADEKGGPGWVEIGYGILRLKKHKYTGARRMLLRNSTTGKININFGLYSGLKPSHAKKAITFIGHDSGVAQTYSVRVGSEDQAKELKEVLEREIAFVKAKSSD